MQLRTAASIVAAALAISASPHAAHAVETATFVFDTTTDPDDLDDGPGYLVTGVDPIDDDGMACDVVAMVMVDATGTPVDFDSTCLSIPAGTGANDGDYGSFATGAVPTVGPVTYALFDLTAEDLAALGGLGDQASFDYVIANARLLAEQTFDVPAPIPNDGAPFSFEPGLQCYQAKDQTAPKPKGVADAAVIDGFGTSTVDVKKLAFYCVPLNGASGPGMCCYKARGAKLEPALVFDTSDVFGEREVSFSAPKLVCKACTRSAVPMP